LLTVLAVGIVSLVVYLLRPAASIDDYAEYFVDDSSSLEDGDVAVTFFGVSTLLFDDGDSQLLIDAFFTRPSKKEFLSEMEEDPEAVAGFVEDYDLDRVSAVFVAHSHVDHAIDVPSLAALTGATIYGSESTLNIGRGGDVDESQLQLVAQDDVIEVGDFSVRVLETPHSDYIGVETPESPPTIGEPLEQPATNAEFAEGGNFTFVITHGDRTIVVVPSAKSRPEMLAGVDADVEFVSTALLGMQDDAYQQAYLDETIGATRPEIVVPLHWDDFISPWSRGAARFNPRIIDKEPAEGFDLVIDRAREVGASFQVLQAGSRLVIRG
jgi:L-ascorbate metabolism protein UlaG (beta-lactamase superfamily)